ncbi:MAG: hypothetical protein J1F11_01570 [Oscillospiraceae bacterium]|nr:hypothetical protein [Oscillospiraceae bacterium]
MQKTYIDVTQKPTPEQIKMLEKAEKLPAVPDDDCPELSKDELFQFRRISGEKRAAAQ